MKDSLYANNVDLFRDIKIVDYRYYIVILKRSGYDSSLFRYRIISIFNKYDEINRRWLYVL